MIALKPFVYAVVAALTLALAAQSGARTVFFQESFEDADFSGRLWYDNTKLSLASNGRAPSSKRAAEFKFLKGAKTPLSGGAMRKKFPPSNSVYVSCWVRYSSNWEGSNKPYHPHEFLILTNLDGDWTGPAYTHLTAYIEQNEGMPLLGLQDGRNIDTARLKQDLRGITENRAVSGCNGAPPEERASTISCYKVGNVYWNGRDWRAGGAPGSHGGKAYFQDTPGPFYKGDWHFVEAYFKLNSIVNGKAASDGVLRYWFDGEPVIDRDNVVLRTGALPQMKFNQFHIAPWIGDGSPVEQSFWIDDLTVADERP
ncbi:MAG: hypothetical protein HY886_10030 [Deltaproteobacteria bacterium]|nr:hypothetical protein [Deltaproteobacteria bacterium]